MIKIVKYYLTTFLALVCCAFSYAQHIQGYVLDLINNQPISNVEIKNLRTNETVKSDRNGAFSIEGQVSDYLSVNIVGYQPDTIYYYDEAIRRIYLNKDENILEIDEVLVKRLTDNLLAKELEKAKNEGKIVEVPDNEGGIKISPSRLFGKKAKQARSNVQLLLEEQNARRIDQRFTKHLIKSLLPLDDAQIALFRERYRPSLDFIKTATDEDLKLYIFDAYKKFKQEH